MSSSPANPFDLRAPWDEGRNASRSPTISGFTATHGSSADSREVRDVAWWPSMNVLECISSHGRSSTLRSYDAVVPSSSSIGEPRPSCALETEAWGEGMASLWGEGEAMPSPHGSRTSCSCCCVGASSPDHSPTSSAKRLSASANVEVAHVVHATPRRSKVVRGVGHVSEVDTLGVALACVGEELKARPLRARRRVVATRLRPRRPRVRASKIER